MAQATCFTDEQTQTSEKPSLKTGQSFPSSDEAEENDPAIYNGAYHDVEFWECGEHESQLHDRMTHCKKNPKHEQFIPVKEFTMEHLPESHRDPAFLDYIMATIGLAVRLVVNFTSPERPDNYPFAHNRGKRGRSVGSGRLRGVCSDFKGWGDESCPCGECSKLPVEDRKRQWGEIAIETSKHVVYNDEEAKETIVYVDFDRYEDRATCLKMNVIRMDCSDLSQDGCEIVVVTHDLELYNMLGERLRHHMALRFALHQKYEPWGSEPNKDSAEMKPGPIVCVSHPHGTSKHVSLGEWKGRQGDQKWKYTTSTCPGSSGAPVFDLGKANPFENSFEITSHSRSLKSGEGEGGSLAFWW